MPPDAACSILSLCPLPEFVAAAFRSTFAVSFLEIPATPQALSEHAIEHDVLLTSITVPLKTEHVAVLPASIRAVATYSVGLDHLDVSGLRDRGIAIFNTPDVLTESVAEVALLHILATLHRAAESTHLIRSRQWEGWTPMQLLGHEALGRKLGIFGMGRIGRALATRSRALGMDVHYCNRQRLAHSEEEGAIFHPDVDRFLASIDVLVLAAPATKATRYFLDATRIAKLRPGSIVVNIARGDLIDDDALIAALRSGHVAAAGLDVFNGEPRIDPRYLDFENVFLTPHIGSSTVEARLRMAGILLDGIVQWRNGSRPRNQVA